MSTNPLVDKLLSLILDRKWLATAGVDTLSAIGDNRQNEIPIQFDSIKDYQQCWEPILVEEIKTCILNSVSRPPAKTGKLSAILLHEKVKVKAGAAFTSSSSIKKILCEVTESFSSSKASSLRSSGASGLQPMDVVLLSKTPLSIPLKRSTLENYLNSKMSCLNGNKSTSTSSKDGGDAIIPTVLAVMASSYSRVELHLSSEGWGDLVKGSESSRDRVDLYYYCIDSLTSSYREFAALSTLRTGVKKHVLQELLNPCVLDELEAREAPSTPPQSGIDFLNSEEKPNFGEQQGERGGGLLLDSLSPLGEAVETESSFFSVESSQSHEAPSVYQEVEFCGKANEMNNNDTVLKSAWCLPGLPEGFSVSLKERFNISQLRAIESAFVGAEAAISSPLTMRRKVKGPSLHGRKCFSLIQGPPGSGKTATVIGLLNAIHLREYDRYYASLTKALLGERGQICRRSQTGDCTAWLNLIAAFAPSKPHILVVAPSNVAVDNIIVRILEQGFVDGTGNRYNPGILRCGYGKSSAVHAVTLEEIVEKEQMSSVTEAECLAALERVDQQIAQIVRAIYTLQTFLMNLSTAFKKHPLPDGWELRVALDTGVPYWVDHSSRSVSMNPPLPPRPTGAGTTIDQDVSALVRAFPTSDVSSAAEEAAVALMRQVAADLNFSSRGRSPYTLETLPEYQLHARGLMQQMERLERCGLLRARCVLRSRQRPSGRGAATVNRQAIEVSVIESSQLLFTTVNSSGHPSVEATEFCVTVIDEAGQCTEPSILIPLSRGTRQCILVGDPEQLPATVMSDRLRRLGFDRSLLERFMQSGREYTLLDTQFRMCPEISEFPSRMFYKGRLKDGDLVLSPSFCPPFIGRNQRGSDNDALSTKPFLRPFMFFDLSSSIDSAAAMGSDGGISKFNVSEAVLCVDILLALIEEGRRFGFGIGGQSRQSLGSIGIITPYSEQIVEIKQALALGGIHKDAASVSGNNELLTSFTFGDTTPIDLEISTVDGFQGREKNFVIISCVRANDYGCIGFLSDIRRMNVALTRARFGLFVVGNGRTLYGNEHWGQLIDHADERGVLYCVESCPCPFMNPHDSHARPFYNIRAIALCQQPNSSSSQKQSVNLYAADATVPSSFVDSSKYDTDSISSTSFPTRKRVRGENKKHGGGTAFASNLGVGLVAAAYGITHIAATTAISYELEEGEVSEPHPRPWSSAILGVNVMGRARSWLLWGPQFRWRFEIK